MEIGVPEYIFIITGFYCITANSSKCKGCGH